MGSVFSNYLNVSKYLESGVTAQRKGVMASFVKGQKETLGMSTYIYIYRYIFVSLVGIESRRPILLGAEVVFEMDTFEIPMIKILSGDPQVRVKIHLIG